MKKNNFFAILYFVLCALFLFGIYLSFDDCSYTGYYTDKIIDWLWLFSTILMILWFWKKKITKLYFTSLLFLLVLSILPMGIPFFGIVYKFSTIGDYQSIDLNDTYRIERTKASALSLARIYIYKKNGIVEKNMYRTPYHHVIENTLQVKSDSLISGVSHKTPIQKAKFINTDNNSIDIEYKILDKTTIYHHTFNEDGY